MTVRRGQQLRVKAALVTGYLPFGAYPDNPTRRVTKTLGERGAIEGIRGKEFIQVFSLILPNQYDTHETVMQRIREIRRECGLSQEEPLVVVSGGLSTSIRAVSLEAVGWNEIDSKYATQDGVLINDGRAIVSDASDGYQTNVDSVSLMLNLAAVRVPSVTSADAGRFTCNSITFGMFHLLHVEGERTLFQFYHSGLTETDSRLELPSDVREPYAAGIKIFHPDKWLEIGVPVMVRGLARQAEALAQDEWKNPIPISKK